MASRDFRRSSEQSRSFIKKDFLTSDGPTFGKREFNRNANSNKGRRSFNKFDSSEASRSFRNKTRGFQRSRYGSRSRFRKAKGSKGIDVNRFIKAAVVKEQEVEYVAKHKFSDFDINETLKKNIAFKGFTTPTPIQDQAIEHLLEGKDLVGIANTGTGKTAAFLIPLIDKVSKSKRDKVLIIVPTRELALQINEDFRSLSKFMNLFSVLCIGGADIRKQMYFLKQHHNFVIGTPGRLKDLIDRNILNLSEFNNIVLDEVDRMLDMGFIDDIKFLISKMPIQRQSLFFSATLSNEIEELMRRFLKPAYVKVSVKTGETSDNVEQNIVRVTKDQKIEKLIELLQNEDFKKVLIFANTKRGVDMLDNVLYKKGFKVSSIHGDKTQYMRQKAIRNFKQDYSKILIATDVAARGLDIPNVSHVINYDAPENYEDYVHRIGRTGRANKKGFALTFVG